MREIGFIEEPDPTAVSAVRGEAERITPRGLASWWSRAGAVVLLAAAPFQTLIGERITQPHLSSRLLVDGWGRRPGGGAGHGPRYGVVCYVIAGLLIGVLVLGTARRGRPLGGRTAGLVRVFAIAAPSMLFGVLFVIALEYDGLSSDADANSGPLGAPRFHAFIGAGTWLLLLAFVLAAAGALTDLSSREQRVGPIPNRIH